MTVAWQTADGSAKAPTDYLAGSGTVTFAPGEQWKPVTVTIVDDDTVEGTQTFKVLLSGAVGATIADDKGVGTIFDDDQYVITVDGAPLSDVVIDPASKFAYATNPQRNEVEVINLRTGALGRPIFVGSRPAGIDITPDGTKLYVCDSGGNVVSVVDVPTRKEIRRISIPAGFMNDTPYSIAIAGNGKAFLTTTFYGSGFGSHMFAIDLATDTVTPRTDFYFGGTTTEVTRLEHSLDRSRLAAVAGDISSGPVFLYSAATDRWSAEKDLSTYVYSVALDGSGSTVLVNPGTYVLDSSLVLQGTITGGGLGVALSAAGDRGYRLQSNRLEVLNVRRFLVDHAIGLRDSVYGGGGQIALSPDGKILAALTDHGVIVLKP